MRNYLNGGYNETYVDVITLTITIASIYVGHDRLITEYDRRKVTMRVASGLTLNKVVMKT